ncbi:DUF1566 domain-containing protein [Flagellimonas nanhaiensis]|uniref:DUF1566 domain-containing protein n=1 Tax=Flagellimonas nanhaiensis TaxID=2292706 RepID=A0A371JW13_9FLAO|nr:DUF1566 domain-containing protein [Allomuricauda nanhaiensis]RDY61970.1 DUF1566 domain-containing protein [Allomuricauda nanhaiensis]
MKNRFRIAHIWLLTLLIATISCNNDDNSDGTTDEIVIEVQDFTLTIDENPSNGESLGSIEATGSNSLSFSITEQTPSGALTINEDTGDLTIADASLFDFETNPMITATVAVVGATETASITINLNNLDELGVQDLIVDIDENPTNGDLIGTVQVNGNGASSFNIDSQTPTGALAIDQSSGELTVADASVFDFETNPIITATVSVIDGIDTATVTVNLNDVVEITLDDLTVSIDENPTDGQVVGTMQANGSGTFSFSITSQTPQGSLAIDSSTGELTVVDPNLFDFETNPVITATILVDDGVETATASATVNLNDVDEVTAQNTNMDIDENPSNGAIVGTLQATGSNLTYTITFQNPAGAFNIDQSTGELSVADETLFDFETNPNMLATISVDNGIQTVSANAIVALNDVNELGEYKYGGVIFWIDPTSNNSEGLVCDVVDQSTGGTWGCTTVDITGAQGIAIGSGEANTAAILASGCTVSSSAAEMVASLDYNGFDDWFLPSRDELNEMFLNVGIINATAIANGGTNLNSAYWSSSQSSATEAWEVLYVDGVGIYEFALGKGSWLNVRAVRSFTDF